MRRRPKQWRIGAALLLSLFCCQIGCGRVTGPSQMKTILVFGDSLSAGFSISPRQAWPMLLLDKLRPISSHFRVINASVSGSTTEDGLHRLARHLDRPIDIFVLELGINDAWRGVPIETIRVNLQSIVDQVKARNPNVTLVIIGMEFPEPSGASDYIAQFGKMFAALADKNRAALVPYLLEGVAGNPELNLPDRVHPNAAGHKVIVETVWRVFEPVARDMAKSDARD
jgi:acyl-CoA thioesterase I